MDLLSYVNIVADVLKTLIKEWNAVEGVAERFIAFVENISLNILGKIN